MSDTTKLYKDYMGQDIDKLRYTMLVKLRGNDLTDSDRIDLCNAYKTLYEDCSTQEDKQWYSNYVYEKDIMLQRGYDYSDYEGALIKHE